MSGRLSIVRRYGPIAAIAGTVLLAMAGLMAFVFFGMKAPAQQARKVAQQVTVIRPPPPPPEVEPPPPEVEDEVDVPEPEEPVEEASAEPPPGEVLGLDAEGVAGGDAFGLAARKGGRDLLAGGSAGAFDWYKNAIGTELSGRMAGIEAIRRKRYSVALRIWLAADGRIERFSIDNSTGDRELDQTLTMALRDLDRLAEAPPEGLPQPVRLRIVSRI
jgi:protein TonB